MRCSQCRTPRSRTVHVRTYQVRKPLDHQEFGQATDLRAELTRQAPCRDLQQAAGLDQCAQPFRVGLRRRVSLGMGKDHRHADPAQFGQHSVERKEDPLGHFHQHVPSAIGQGHQPAVADPRRQVVLQADFGPRPDTKRDAFVAEKLLVTRGALANRVGVRLGEHAELVRCGHGRAHSLGHGGTRRLQRTVPIDRPVIQAGQQMAMQVEELLVQLHSGFLARAGLSGLGTRWRPARRRGRIRIGSPAVRAVLRRVRQPGRPRAGGHARQGRPDSLAPCEEPWCDELVIAMPALHRPQ